MDLVATNEATSAGRDEVKNLPGKAWLVGSFRTQVDGLLLLNQLPKGLIAALKKGRCLREWCMGDAERKM